MDGVGKGQAKPVKKKARDPKVCGIMWMMMMMLKNGETLEENAFFFVFPIFSTVSPTKRYEVPP